MPGSIPGAVLCSFPQQPRSRGPVTWAFRDHRPSPGDASARRHGNLAYLLEGPGPWWATGRSQVTRNLQALGPTRDEWEGEALCGLSRPLAFLRPQSPLCAGLPPGALTSHTSSEPSALGNTAGRQEEVPAPTPAPTCTSREKALSKLEKRNLAHIWPHREPHPLCTLSCQAPGPPHPLSLLSPQAQRRPGVLLLRPPQSAADAAQGLGLDAEHPLPDSQPGPVTWEWTQMKGSGQRQRGALSHVSCQSPKRVCGCGARASVCFLSGLGFLTSPRWAGPGPLEGSLPQAKGLQGASCSAIKLATI